MTTAAQEIARRVLELGEEDRCEVAALVLASLEDNDVGIAELERRASDLESGAVEAISWEDLEARLTRPLLGT